MQSFENRLALSFYKDIAVINEGHNIYLVQHIETRKIFVKKILTIFNQDIYNKLKANPITGTPQIFEVINYDEKLIIIEEYINGDTLEEKMNKNELTDSLISYYIIQLCNIIKSLHNSKPSPIIHRDIKPSNVIITSNDNVVLLDFNAAKYYNKAKTSDTFLIGTKEYAAPEQYGFGASGPQTDIYAIGIMLKELTHSINCKRFDKIIKKCTQLNPADRYVSIEDLKNNIIETCCDLLNNLEQQNNNFNPNYYKHSRINKYRNFYKFIPPGFVNHTLTVKILSLLGYIFTISICLSLEPKDATPQRTLFERILCTVIAVIIIFSNGNYLGIRHKLPFQKSKFKAIRLLGIVLFDILVFIATLIIIVLIENLFGVI